MYKFSSFEKYDESIIHFISTKKGGVSEGDYESLNIGFGVPDNPNNVIENRKTLAKNVNIPIENFVFCNQVHQNKVVVITQEEKSAGVFDKSTAIKSCDAMITAEPDICLCVMAADCLPLLFFDEKRNVIAACHAGWRGTISLITQEVVKSMQYHFDCQIEDIIVGLAPCISAEKYPIGEEIVKVVKEIFGTEEGFLKEFSHSTQKHFDLHYANIHQLKEMGIAENQIEILPFCTYQNPNDFFSARYAQHHQKQTGRFCEGIMLKNKKFLTFEDI
ncbi:MAG: peptidoglycan editing factor PgeF [Bacteroidetes bacterium]|nr:MAG: peptidoglycan editing factor PgeF [Bacteroidota bacterium]